VAATQIVTLCGKASSWHNTHESGLVTAILSRWVIPEEEIGNSPRLATNVQWEERALAIQIG
jgi:hypothetical protein